MNGFISYEDNFEEDAMFNMQPVEVDKKRRRREGTRDIVDKPGCTNSSSLHSLYRPAL